jgi:hypothetical protein
VLGSAVTLGAVRSGTGANVMPADFGPSIPTVHTGFVPEQAPLQRTSLDPAAAAARRATAVPARKLPEQAATPQRRPAGTLDTVPRPVLVTASGKRVPSSTNAATAVRASLRTSPQRGATPLHASRQPAKRQPAAGAAESVTRVPAAGTAPHDSPQSMPP